jgi:hypothetical protein
VAGGVVVAFLPSAVTAVVAVPALFDIYGGKPFKAVLTDLGLTSNQVWGPRRLIRNGPTSSRPP